MLHTIFYVLVGISFLCNLIVAAGIICVATHHEDVVENVAEFINKVFCYPFKKAKYYFRKVKAKYRKMRGLPKYSDLPVWVGKEAEYMAIYNRD